MVSRFITDCYEFDPTGCLKCVVKLGVQNRMWICLLNCVHNNIKIFVTCIRRGIKYTVLMKHWWDFLKCVFYLCTCGHFSLLLS